MATIAWVSDSAFVCSTTEHSDTHNQQYNRPGNRSTGAGTLRAYPGHRIVRLRVVKGENASEAMRLSQDPWLYSSVVSSAYDSRLENASEAMTLSQDPWLYSSVVSSAYDSRLDVAYTSSFDRIVKAWKVDPTGKAMELAGTWPHAGIVNFVVTSHHQDLPLVATATDTICGAICIYKVNPDDISTSSYLEWGGRIAEAGSAGVESDAWAYYPATIQWGVAPICKRSTGELRMINAMNGRELSMGITMCQNIFEVLWHPTRPVCNVAISASKAEAKVHTQVCVYALSSPTAANSASVSSAEFCSFTMVLDCFSPPGHLPGEESDLDSRILRARNFLQKGQLFQHRNPVLGVFQGPNYSELNFYRREAHWDEEPSNPLLADAERDQQVNKLASRTTRGGIGSRISFGRSRRIVLDKADDHKAVRELHKKNCQKDLNWEELSEDVKAELVASGVDLTVNQDYGLEFERDEFTGDSDTEEVSGDRDEGVSFSNEESWSGVSYKESTRRPSPCSSTVPLYLKMPKIQGFFIGNKPDELGGRAAR